MNGEIMNKPLIDRMAEVIEIMKTGAFGIPFQTDNDVIPMQVHITNLLNEYRNRPPEISQETAQWLLAEARNQVVREELSQCEAGHKLWSRLVARAESEMKGEIK